MKKIIVLIGTILAFAFNGVAQIEGNVVDTASKAIPEAIIIMIDTVKNTADTIKSDKRGYYTFKGIKKGNYKIVARAAGYEEGRYENIIVDNETADDDRTGSDISNATWLEIILKPARPRK